MNKDLLVQLSAEERAAAEKLSSAAEMMKLSQSFQSNLETQLMDVYSSQNQKRNMFMQFLKPVGWVVIAIVGVLLANWMFRNLLPGIQAGAGPTVTPEVSFESNVRQGNICAAPLAVSNGFAVFLTSPDKAQLTAVDPDKTIGEVRSFTWSADGKELLIHGNTLGSANIYRADLTSGQVEPTLATGELGYMMDAAWSRDGKKVVMWSAQNNKVLYVVSSDGTGFIEKQLQDVQIIGAPQFTPDGDILFLGANANNFGLFLMTLEGSQPALVVPAVEDASGFAFSPDGSLLAYVEYDRDQGEARLVTQKPSKGEYQILGTLPMSQNSGAAVPHAANLSWSADGKSIVFDVGRGANDRVIYLAHVGGTELVKVVDAGYAPVVSSDGKCLAYLNNKQLWLLDLSALSTSIPTTPIWIADLPEGRGIPNYQLDKLQWRPIP